MTTKAKGLCLIDGVQVGEASIQVDSVAGTAVLSGKFALVNHETGQRFGYSNKNNNWSDETRQKLVSLLESMERDTCQDLFAEAPGAIGSGEVLAPYPTDSVPGL